MLSLKSIVKRAVLKIYQYDWDKTKILPVTLQDELLTDWLKCDEELLEDFEAENEFLLERGYTVNVWRRIKRIMCPQVFEGLMNYPSITVKFADNWNHIVTNSIWWYVDGDEIGKLCENCWVRMANPSALDSAVQWELRGWSFIKEHSHYIVSAEDVIDQIHDRLTWCHICVYASLIDIFTYEECESETSFHEFGCVPMLNRIKGNNLL